VPIFALDINININIESKNLKPSEFITLIAGPQYSYLIKQKDEFTNTMVMAIVIHHNTKTLGFR
jgi:hypothetical protein